MSPIDVYLSELRRALRFRVVRRRRLLAEVEGHLRESAEALRRAGRTAEEAEHEAVARFGAPDAVAADAVRAAGPAGLSWAAGLLAAALAFYVLPLYAIPENTLPAAPWAERPDHLTWKLYVALAAYGLAVALVLPAFAAARLGWTRLAFAALLASAAALTVSAIAATVLAIQWAAAAPGSGTTLALALPATAATSVLVLVAVATATLYARPSPRPTS